MPSNFDQAFEEVKQLAADFKANEHFYLSPLYQEAETRRDFIDKFLMALGWDVNHDTQKNPYEQEVKVERKEHGVSQRRADYAFYLAPNFQDVKFHIEAKKPFADIATPDNYFQTIRYGWGSKTPIAALFDFAQFEIVDCRFKPNLETALQRNLKKFHYSQYTDKETFAEIYWLFSREAVAGGSLEKYAETLPKKRGAAQRGQVGGGGQSVDDSFLEELDGHRDALAHIFKNHNPKLDGETLTEVTQRTLDRLVFIRFLEDNLIEPQNLVAGFGERGSAWGEFIAASRRLDGIYNGIVFKKHDILDQPNFKVDDGQFAKICKALCHVNSIYDFNSIPIHILGSIYERFLGKVIVATGKRARVEEKPEVRKAGGVYYTPEYIVRYIVENTVGRLIAGKTPAQIAEMRFADIACGSGSFLLGIYDLLIRHHAKFYNENRGKAKMDEVVERDDGLHLSLEKKRDILLNNIYGVDIDRQAVEVAQLSLYLKLLQDETPSSARTYQLEFHETLLPSLNRNIVCGNSLIGTDILTGQLFASDEEKKLNPMDFEQRFPHIFARGTGVRVLRETATSVDFDYPGAPIHGSFSYKKKKFPRVAPQPMPPSEYEGGFDAIVGNPPYIDSEWMTRYLAKERDYCSGKYVAASGNWDIFCVFIDRAVQLVKQQGLVSLIVPNKLGSADYAAGARKVITSYSSILSIRDFSHIRVFPVSVYPIVFVTRKSKTSERGTVDYERMQEIDGKVTIELSKRLDCAEYFSNPNRPWQIFASLSKNQLVSKMSERFPKLAACATVLGAATVSEAYEIAKLIEDGSRGIKLVNSGTIDRFHCLWGEKECRYLGKSYLKPIVSPTKQLRLPKRRLEQAKNPKIIIAGMTLRLECVADLDGEVLAGKSTSIVFPKYDLRYMLGILNSQAVDYFYSSVFGGNKLQGGYLRVGPPQLAEIPVPVLDLSSAADKAKHDRMVELVEQMLAVEKQLAAAQTDKDKDFYSNRCDGLDRQIDALVYELYGFTPDEIKIVEQARA